MRLSKLLFKSHKETSNDEMGNNLIRGCMVLQESSGIFQYLPLGFMVMENIRRIIRNVLNLNELQEVMLPILQDMKLWVESGRDKVYGPEMFKLKNRDNRDFCLCPTAEESIVYMVKNFISSYTSLPIILYQMSRKYRDEMRPRFCLIRNKEFEMMDAYSFDRDKSSANLSYTKMYHLYVTIFEQMNLDFVFAAADCGEVGGSFSQNAFVRSKMGEDELCLTIPWEQYSQHVKKAKTYEDMLNLSQYISTNGLFKYAVVEVGHIFNLGTKYSASMNALFTDNDGTKKHYEMGCYGIGVSRLMQVLFEDKCLPLSVTPYQIHLIGIQNEQSETFYSMCQKNNINVLFDDRDCGPGAKFHDSDLINIPYRVIIGRGLEFQNRFNDIKYEFTNLNELYLHCKQQIDS
jgi:prolyl-tRNA synthetase